MGLEKQIDQGNSGLCFI